MRLRDGFALTKFTISAFSALSAGAGFAAARHALGGGVPLAALLPLGAGTLLLAMGASAFNEVLERDLDARMRRTRDRPVARGALGPWAACAIATALCGAGAAVLGRGLGPLPQMLGLAALGWYVLVYTPLKRRSPYAVVPGALIGALPPAMGWTAAGGGPVEAPILAIGLVFFLWQVPHFWMLALLHGQDYAAAGLPTPLVRLEARVVRRLAFAWACGTAIACLLLPATGVVARPLGLAILGAGACLWVLRTAPLLGAFPGPRTVRRAFGDSNLFILEVMAALALG